MKAKLNKIILSLLVVLSLVGCNRHDELKNDDYSFKVTKNINKEAEIFLSNKSGKKQENVRVIIYIKLLDTNEKYVFYENTYETLDKDQIVWDNVNYSNEVFVNKMVVVDVENDTIKNNFELIYEVYDNR